MCKGTTLNCFVFALLIAVRKCSNKDGSIKEFSFLFIQQKETKLISSNAHLIIIQS